MKKKTNPRTLIALLVLAVAVLVAVATDLAVRGLGSRLGYTVPHPSGSDTAMHASPTAARPPAEPLDFTGPDGNRLTLEDFRGRVVLLNLWATWCPPCVAEMPDLDALQARLGGERFQVVAVALDRGGPAAVRRWLDQAGLRALAAHAADPAKFPGAALPTSILIDAQGREAWRGLGGWPWESPDIIAEIEKLVAEPTR